MSFRAMAAVLHHSQTSGSDRAVMLSIAFYSNDDLEDAGAWPSQQTLANRANVSVRQLRRIVDRLVDLGEIEVLKHKGATYGAGYTNRYFLNIDCPEWCDSSLNHKVNADIEGTNSGHVGYQMRTSGVSNADTYDLLTIKNY